MGKSTDLWSTRMQRFSKDAVEDQDLHVLCNINIYGRQISNITEFLLEALIWNFHGKEFIR